jgi:TPP-dependent pyruvate/acetoin dehydrogenase alpha subunit
MTAAYEDIFYQALRIRMAEEKITEIYPSDRIQSPVHLSIGQEHHIAALMSQLHRSDQVYTSYRNHAVYLAKGGDMKKMFAELFGRSTGISGGKAGSMHLSCPEANMMGSSAIVASSFPHAAGAAYSFKMLKSGAIAVSVNGEGAMEEGVFHESLNFSALKALPVLFVIENNDLAIHSRQNARQSFSLEKLAAAYGIKYFKSPVGSDMRAVSSLSSEIAGMVRSSKQPAVYEILTCRYKSHVGVSEDYDKGYRDKSEIEKWKAIDPLINDTLLVSKFKERIDREIRDAVAYAENSPLPDKIYFEKGCY